MAIVFRRGDDNAVSGVEPPVHGDDPIKHRSGPLQVLIEDRQVHLACAQDIDMASPAEQCREIADQPTLMRVPPETGRKQQEPWLSLIHI